MLKAGVLGASGYAGGELLGLLAGHPEVEVTVAGAKRNAGQSVAAFQPSLAPAYPTLSFVDATAGALAGLDVVFLALPHGESQAIVPELDPAQLVVDLAADFRTGPEAYEAWYGHPHAAPALCGSFVTGVVERSRAALGGAKRIAVPGCYPTATTLALGPLLDAGLVEPSGIVVDAVSGVSGAGRKADEDFSFSALDEDVRAYGLFTHRHTGEIEQLLGAEVIFTPHLVPMVRGMLATCYARPSSKATVGAAKAALEQAYADEPFVTVCDEPPSTKWATGSNAAFVWAGEDPRTGWTVAMGAIDNLVKGAAGQAVQAANLALGLDETAGLPVVGRYP